jgi:5-methylcytosine-specific restriction endonuclease McrA
MKSVRFPTILEKEKYFVYNWQYCKNKMNKKLHSTVDTDLDHRIYE